MLSHQDRRRLAEIETAMAVEDPALEFRLRTGHVPAFPWLEDHALLIGATLCVLGAVATVVFLMVSIWVSLAGEVAMIAGAVLLGTASCRNPSRALPKPKRKSP